MPNNKDRDKQPNQDRLPQSGGQPGEQGGRREMSHGRDVDLDEEREREESQDREPQSGGRGETGGKQRDIKDGDADLDIDDGRNLQSNDKDQSFEPLDRPGGDSRVSQRSEDRDDEGPDEPMPPRDGSRK